MVWPYVVVTISLKVTAMVEAAVQVELVVEVEVRRVVDAEVVVVVVFTADDEMEVDLIEDELVAPVKDVPVDGKIHVSRGLEDRVRE